jgi:hypothetical protein
MGDEVGGVDLVWRGDTALRKSVQRSCPHVEFDDHSAEATGVVLSHQFSRIRHLLVYMLLSRIFRDEMIANLR